MQNSITIRFPRESTPEYVQETMIKKAREGFNFLIDEQASLATLRNLQDSIMSDAWEMQVKKMEVL